jgi:5-methylcytosine-specific restriction endonuclease McrA
MERIRKIATDRREHSDGMANARTLYARYKVSARNRDYEFLLLFDEFYKLTQMDCVYCGDKPNSILAQKNTVGSITYNGIDRRDNTLGYTLENCYPCCSRCNKAKLTMTHDQFLDMCRTIVRKWD